MQVGNNTQAPSTNHQIITKIPMSEIFPSSYSSPLGGEGEGEGLLDHLHIGELRFISKLRFGYWDLD
jgi:hypothetical protein